MQITGRTWLAANVGTIAGQVGGFFAALLTIPVVTILTILVRELRPLPGTSEASENAVSATPRLEQP